MSSIDISSSKGGSADVSRAGPEDRPKHAFICGGPEPLRQAIASQIGDAVGRGSLSISSHEEAGLEGALESDCAVVVAPAERQLDDETRRLCCALSVLRIPGILLILGVDPEDTGAERLYEELADQFLSLVKDLGATPVACIPVTSSGVEVSWYRGVSTTDTLSRLPVPNGRHEMPFRMLVEKADGPGLAGRLLAGSVAEGDTVTVLPGGETGHVIRAEMVGQQAPDVGLTLTLADGETASVGDVVAEMASPPEIADQVAAKLVWLGEDPMLPGRVYSLVAGHNETTANVSDLKYRLNIETLEQQAAKTLATGEVGMCNLSIGRPLVFETGGAIRELGRFRLIDRESNALVGVGMIDFGLHRATNLKWQALDIDKAARSDLKGQRPCILWFTGLSGAGKSSVANILEKKLHAAGRHTYILDGDNVRHGLNRDLGFTDADRVENIRRVAETARLMVDAGLIVMASFISPFRMERLMARELFADEEFIEVFVDAPIDVCEERDPKGLYKKARAGLVKNFTGIDSAYEPPETPEIHLDAAAAPADALAEQVVDELRRRRLI